MSAVKSGWGERPKPTLVTGANISRNEDVYTVKTPFGDSGEPPDNGGMEARLATLEQAVKELPTKVDFAELRADMSEGREAVHKLLLENSRWTHTALVSMLSVAVIGILGLLFTIWNATKPSSNHPPAAIAQPSQQPPIIINIPPLAAPPAQGKQ